VHELPLAVDELLYRHNSRQQSAPSPSATIAGDAVSVVVRLDATTLLRKAPSPGGRTIAPPGTKMMVTSKKWTSYRALAAAEGEIVASCQGGKSQIITSNNTNGVATTEAAANIPSLPKMSG
jgi:hypothetical protein